MAKPKKSGGWNSGKTVGCMRPFTLEQVQLIRGLLRSKNDLRELALFETGISTLLRSSDLLKLTVTDVISQGKIIDAFDCGQQKTKRPVRVSLSEDSQKALMAYIVGCNMRPEERLWPIGRLRYSQIVKGWARMVNADPRFYSTHSIRRTYPTHLYQETGNAEYARQLLGHQSLARTGAYLGIENEQVHAVKKRIKM